jgi:leucyl aminopeptidase
MPRFTVHTAAPKGFPLAAAALQGESSASWTGRSAGPAALLSSAGDDGFRGKAGEALFVRSSGAEGRVLLLGAGKREDVSLQTLRLLGAAAVKKAGEAGAAGVAFLLPGRFDAAEEAQAVVEGAGMAAYRFERHKSRPAPASALKEVALIAPAGEAAAVRAAARRGEAFVASVDFARDLINEPPSKKTPETLGRVAASLAKAGIKTKVYRKADLVRMKAEALLGVNRGSAHPPVLIHLHYKPSGKASRRIALVGKGITFDSGGLSLKTAEGMMTMKYDMAGAASIMSVFLALAALKPSVEVHGVAPVTENLPGPDAYKPGDVMRALNGKTIEVLNTDAEGRIVLADALSFASKLPVDDIVDIATLTGAATIALGRSIAAVMANDDGLMARVEKAAAAAGEKVWRLPLEKEYKEHIKSKVADLKNIGNPGEAGTIIGGLFLEEFVGAGKRWAHIDMAAVGWSGAATPFSPAGATGAMVRTLLNLVFGAG